MNGRDRCFADTNIWFYSLSNEDESKRDASQKLIEVAGENLCFSSQIINEISVNLKKKAKVDENEIRHFIKSLFLNYRFVSIDEEVLTLASGLREAVAVSFWDSFVVAAALVSECETLYTEDMQHGRLIDGRLTIINPFLN